MNSFISKLIYTIGQKIFGRLLERQSRNPGEETPLEPGFAENQKTIERINRTNYQAYLLLFKSFSIKRLFISSLIVDYLIFLFDRNYLPLIQPETLTFTSDILSYALIGIAALILFKGYYQHLLNQLFERFKYLT